jgi:predicted transcriptional regulator
MEKKRIGLLALKDEKLQGKLDSLSRRRRGGLTVTTIKELSTILTHERIRMLRIIKEQNPSSISELASMLGRDWKNVSVDINYLYNLGLVELRQNKKNKKPYVKYNEILMRVRI